MADRILIWHLEGIVGDGTNQGETYYMEQDYIPVGLRIMAKRVPDADDLAIDILDDGVTILSRQAKLPKGQSSDDSAEEWSANPPTILEGSLVTLNVASNGAKGITVQLELEAG